jgi:hypothetical protein
MHPLTRRAPLLGGLSLLSAAACFGWSARTGSPAPADASVLFAGLAFVMGLLAPGRRATLLLVVPSLVYLSLMVDVTPR